MRYQIRDVNKGIIVDQNLSLEEALMWIDGPAGRCYVMEPMKEDDQR